MTEEQLAALVAAEQRRRRMTAIRALPSDKRAAASRANGTKGGRPSRCPACQGVATLVGRTVTANVYECRPCELRYLRRAQNADLKVGTNTRRRRKATPENPLDTLGY